jgi:fused signal recognition particle receptor
MDFELYLKTTADSLISLGVPAEYGQIAALGLVYLGLTLLILLLVRLLLRVGRRSQRRAAAEGDAAESSGKVAAEPAATEVECTAATDVDEPAPPVEAAEPAHADDELSVAADETTDEPVAPALETAPTPSLYQRMRKGLAKTRSSLVGRVDALLGSHGRLDDAFLEELEEILITADFGMQATQELVQALTARMREADQGDAAQLREILGEEIRARIKSGPVEWPTPQQGPLVIMVVGVNGVGKTTTIGKLARQFAAQGKKVVLGAGDTFRAAAAEQLEAWGERSGAEVIRHAEGSDPGAVAFDAAKAAVARKADVLILDTAGRLHTKLNLMQELKKVRRVLDREIPGAPHETLLVLDATTGQNALIQARTFQQAVAVSGIALTKLDGTAKGGIVVAISSQLDLPVRLIGVGEGVDDLRPFDADEFVAALFADD